MKPRISYVTLGVDDLDRAVRFYRDGLGLETKGILDAEDEEGGVAFFELGGGVVLALWPRASIAKDTGLPMGAPNATELTLAHNVASTEEVDEVMAEAGRAGARILRPAQATFWGGYSGYFQDPDGHVWEVAWNPEYKIPV
jgi:catechol 2,3-dioxygenase-like lactoylglutathione lyase family enzyme